MFLSLSGSSPLIKWNLILKTVTCSLWRYSIRLYVVAPSLIVSKTLILLLNWYRFPINYMLYWCCACTLFTPYAQIRIINKWLNVLCLSSLCSGVSGPLSDGRLWAVLRNHACVYVDVMDWTPLSGSLSLYCLFSDSCHCSWWCSTYDVTICSNCLRIMCASLEPQSNKLLVNMHQLLY